MAEIIIPSVSATPDSFMYISNTSVNKKQQVKSATPDIVLFDDESGPIEVISDLIFEDIGGQELIGVVRNDLVNGQKVSYSLIRNLDKIEKTFNSNNIVSLQQTSDKYFNNFGINLDSKLPKQSENTIDGNVYLDPLTGDIVINLINLRLDEQVEVQITTSGTIYEAEL